MAEEQYVYSSSESDSDDDDRTIPMEEVTAPESEFLVYMERVGNLCNNENADIQILAHGLDGAVMQDMHCVLNRDIEGNSERANMEFAGSKLKELLKLAVKDAMYLYAHKDKKFKNCEFHCGFANLGYQLMAIGLWAALLGPYTKNHVLNTVENFVDAAKQAERKDMAKWLWALSMGMECSDLTAHAGYNILRTNEQAPVPEPGSPDGKMSPSEMRSYMEGQDGANKKRKA